MTKAEYIVTKYWCHIRCKPDNNRCRDCGILKTLVKIYDDRRQED